MRLSVILSCYDQHKITIEHIKGCMASTRIPDEIIVVNDGGDSSLKEMIEEMEKKCPVIYARITEDIRWNQNGARNLGIWLSRGDYIAVEDNDHIPCEDFYEGAIKLLEEGYDRVYVKKRLVVKEDDFDKLLKTRPSAQIISLVKREKLVGIKGFDEEFCGHYGWDVPDFSERIERQGEKVICWGEYKVVAGYSRINDRTFIGVKNKPKMENVNWHLLAKNRRDKIIQPEKGILNFKYETYYL